MNEDTGAHYLQPWQIGETIQGLHGVGSVVDSKNNKFHSGDLVHGNMMWPWSRYFVLNDKIVQRYLHKVTLEILKRAIQLPSICGICYQFGLYYFKKKSYVYFAIFKKVLFYRLVLLCFKVFLLLTVGQKYFTR